MIAAVDTLDVDGPRAAIDLVAPLAVRLRRPLLLAAVLGAHQVAAAAGPLTPRP